MSMFRKLSIQAPLFCVCAIVYMLLFVSCRQDIVIWPSEEEWVGEVLPDDSIRGFYLLNEGGYSNNNSSLDYYDYTTAIYTHNIYSALNPSSVMGLGDVGNSLKIYGSRLWAVLNGSNKIEVMQAQTARRIGQVDIANPRHICFHEGYAYISSFAGPVQDDYTQLGMVVKVDTLTLEKVDTCLVGFQPEGLDVVGDKIYVANSGGYMYPNYDNTLSVISIATFQEERRITVAPNLQRVLADRQGNLWVSSLGNYYDQPSALFRVSNLDATPSVTGILTPQGNTLAVGNMTLCGDSLYVVSNDFSYTMGQTSRNFAIVNTLTATVLSTNFITDGTETSIQVPYGIAVHPTTGDILIGDARDYYNPGTLFCFSPQGILRWKVHTGVNPAHIVFLGGALNHSAFNK